MAHAASAKVVVELRVVLTRAMRHLLQSLNNLRRYTFQHVRYTIVEVTGDRCGDETRFGRHGASQTGPLLLSSRKMMVARTRLCHISLASETRLTSTPASPTVFMEADPEESMACFVAYLSNLLAVYCKRTGNIAIVLWDD